MDEVCVCQRHLPHWHLDGATYFVTFRQHPLPLSASALSPAERRLVRNVIVALHPHIWRVTLLCVMPDHVHLIAVPQQNGEGGNNLSWILRRVKGSTACMLNVGRDRSGLFWQNESFDRIIRSSLEYQEKATYILHNAVKAGLVSDPWEYDGLWADEVTTGQ